MGCCFTPDNSNNQEQSNSNNKEIQLQNQAPKQVETTSYTTTGNNDNNANTNDESQTQKDARGQSKITVQVQDLIKQQTTSIQDQYVFYNQPISSNEYMEIKKATHKTTGLVRQVKTIKKKKATQEQLDNILNELKILISLDHPNILKLYEYYQDDDYLYIVSELCQGGDLIDILPEDDQQDPLTEEAIANIMRQIFSSVAYCHKNNIILRNINLDCLKFDRIGQNQTLKITDFGTSLSSNINSASQELVGDVSYLAPEALHFNYSFKSDVWSCGIILYLLFCGYPPFYEDTTDQTIEAIKNNQLVFGEDWDQIPHEIIDFLQQLLEKDANKRLSSEDALNHVWLQKKAGEYNKDVQLSAGTLKNLTNLVSASKFSRLTWNFMSVQLKSKLDEEHLIEQFKAIDKNGDGILSREELIEGYQKVFAGQNINIEEEVDAILKTADTNDNNELDYSEFVTLALNKQQMLTNDKIDEVFAIFDKDGNGQITQDELEEVFGQKNNKQNLDYWKKVIAEVDQDGDGQISKNEFRDMMMVYLQNSQKQQ